MSSKTIQALRSELEAAQSELEGLLEFREQREQLNGDLAWVGELD